MTTQTSQPGGDGQLLRGAPALRAAARNALTARGPAEPAERPEPGEPTELGETAEPVPGVGAVETVDPAGRPELTAAGEAGVAGASGSGWHQNVRLLTGPPAEPGPPDAGEPPGAGAGTGAEAVAEPVAGYGAGPEACYGGTGPEVAGVVEWVAAEEEPRKPEPESRTGVVEPAPVEPPGETGSPVVLTDWDTASGVRAGGGAGPGDLLETVRTETPAPPVSHVVPETRPEETPPELSGTATGEPSQLGVPTDHEAQTEPGAPSEPGRPGRSVQPVVSVEFGEPVEIGAPTPVPEAADVPHSREESWALAPADAPAPAEADAPDGPAGDGPTEDPEPAAADTAGAPSSPAAEAPGGVPVPSRDISVRPGCGSVVPTRAALTTDPQRWSPLIVGEATHEIPVHLLFRDEAAVPVPVPAAGRPRARRAPGAVTVSQPPALAPAASRPATPVDTKLVERPGPTLPGWTAALAGVAGLFGCAVVLWWAGAVPDALTEMFGLAPRPYRGIGIGMWTLLALAVTLTLFAFGGLGRGRVGHAWVLTLFGEYRGSVRRTGLLWVSPLLLRRRVDVRLRHWRSEPMPAVDANGTALRVVVLVVWRVRDTVRAALGVHDHEEYLREQVESAMARVLSQLPADAFHEAAPTLRDAEAVGEALTRMLSAECRPVGLDIFSAQPTRIEYAPEIAAAMQRSRIAAIDARHRDTVLTSVVDAVDDTVHRLTSRGLVELDDYERKVLVKDLTVAFYTGRHGLNEGN
ncbi:SPFH domain-containing protein [Streptomyces sp. NBC_01498]|uniref:SPFH domain-containing protein n=1 Tax=Streptomyces sp. NBC_01498 TaxID=2975870 RepID=UPI002E7B4F06|nr:SPFH domain-containing protein [Streptomyces sp. NBC_01498]WTL26741.1 SPFH domain-containing protein [Streptomyces sp. NBC_01498]